MWAGALDPGSQGNCSGDAGEVRVKAAARGCTSQVLTGYSLLLLSPLLQLLPESSFKNMNLPTLSPAYNHSGNPLPSHL